MKCLIFFFMLLFSTININAQSLILFFLDNKNDTIEIYNEYDKIILNKIVNIDTINFKKKGIDPNIFYIKLANSKNYHKVYASEKKTTIRIEKINNDLTMHFEEYSLNQIYSEIQNIKKEYSQRYMSVYKEMRKNYKEGDTLKANNMMMRYNAIRDSLDNFINNYFLNDTSYLALEFLYNNIGNSEILMEKKEACFANLKHLNKLKLWKKTQKLMNIKPIEEGNYISNIIIPSLKKNNKIIFSKDKSYFVFFWMSDCPACISKIPKINSYSISDTCNISIIGININYNYNEYSQYKKNNPILFKNIHCIDYYNCSPLVQLRWASVPFGFLVKNNHVVKKNIGIEEAIIYVNNNW